MTTPEDALTEAVASALSILPESFCKSPAQKRKGLLDLAILAEAAGRSNDAISFMFVLMVETLSKRHLLSMSELNILARTLKTKLVGLRETLKLLNLILRAESVPTLAAVTLNYSRQLEAGVVDLAARVVNLVEAHIVPVCEDALSDEVVDKEGAGGGDTTPSTSSDPPATPTDILVFSFKLAADYCRYVAECCSDPGIVSSHSDSALRFYSKARGYCDAYLHPASPVALGVILNHTVFLFEIRKCEEEARDYAAAAIHDAEVALNGEASSAGTSSSGSAGSSSGSGSVRPPLTPGERREARDVLGLLKENLEMWEDIMDIPPTQGRGK